jgi:HSP20 family protein
MANMQRRPDDGNLSQRAPERLDPFRLMNEMLQQWTLPQWLERRGRDVPEGTIVPDFNVKERPDAYVIEADLPGMKDEDVDVTLTGNRLTIGGRREIDRETKNEQYYTFERQYGSFSRSFVLPDDVEGDKIDADLESGVLRVTVPKREGREPRKISLKSRIKKALKS